jgi:hypothetical protein
VPSGTLVPGDRTKLSGQIVDVDGVIGSINPGLIESAGVEAFTFSEEFRKSQVTLANCKILQQPEIANHAMALAIITPHVAGVSDSEFTRDEELSNCSWDGQFVTAAAAEVAAMAASPAGPEGDVAFASTVGGRKFLMKLCRAN